MMNKIRKSQIHLFHIDHNIPCLPTPPPPPKKKNFAYSLFPIFPGYYSHPKRNQRQWLCKIWGGGVKEVHYTLYENGELVTGV